jgi:hypothetical protein
LDYYGKRLATCSSDRTVKVYDVTGEVQNNEQLLTGYESSGALVLLLFFSNVWLTLLSRL